MLATDKQINYLQSLADRLKRNGFVGGSYPEYIIWSEERSKGMTTTDASRMIGAYKSLIVWTNASQSLLGKPQI